MFWKIDRTNKENAFNSAAHMADSMLSDRAMALEEDIELIYDWASDEDIVTILTRQEPVRDVIWQIAMEKI